MVLERAGYRTLTASTGQEGVEIIYHEHPDVVLLDEMLPDVTGSEICKQLKTDPQVAHIPVIIHSGGAKVYNRGHLQRIGANAGLPKPSSVPSILQTVANCLHAHK
jgi:CheY-like chemotaxis protein